MAEGYLDDAVLLVRGPSHVDIVEEVTDDAGWTNFSGLPGTWNITETRETSRRPPYGGNPRGRVAAQAEAGTLALTIDESEEAGLSASAFFQACQHRAAGGRFNFVLKPTGGAASQADAWKPGGATDSPQYQGSAIITSYQPYQDGTGAVAVVAVTAELDRDYDVYR